MENPLLGQSGLQILANQLADAHFALQQAAYKLGGEACFQQARLDVKELVEEKHMELPDAMHTVYKKIIDQLAAQR